MAPLLFLFLLAHLGSCLARHPRADGGQPHLHIFHHSCALKKDEGPCKALKDRFYFDIDTGRCEPFEFGGCQGNANNFETLEECEEMCTVKANKSPCHLEDEPGPCRGLVPRYFFDSKKQECTRFFYGGCFGNANNFKTLKECQDRCQPGNDTEEPGHDLKPEEGAKPSRVPVIKHVRLTETGLQSQPHRLPEVEKDTNFTLPNVCLSPVARGDCGGSERRFVYNPKVKRCQVFRYSGCGGNKNNFTYKKQCIKMCMPDHKSRLPIRIKKKNSNILFRSI
ncbi:tissue factor pathway inhibitor a isoform X1 [Pygocentrus nattereri]|uniref:Tissue factor pathway inhibitor n=1 Tax=Pygocentrus nattereri TaxID=42514 RepID=A0AAR2JRK6_PYGNA|nr:tissue factor pathway inhibitor a isoform X1 [Pygocentrus nattereri]